MQDTSFIDLTKEENLEKMIIDERLIPVFKKMMVYFQKYFNKMGYTKIRDYEKFFKEYLLHPYYKLLIRCNKEPSRDNCNGFFNYVKNTLTVDEKLLESDVYLLDVFAHEFIHFLVLKNSVSKPQETDSALLYSFINEALTEILTLRIFPLTIPSYFPQIKMLKFWLTINDKEIDMNTFLNEGKFYVLSSKYLDLMNKYETNLQDGSEHISDALKNKDYINIQRYLIKEIDINISTLEEYDNIITKFSKRPVLDKEYMDRYYKYIDKTICDNLQINDRSIRRRFIHYLKEYRKIKEYIENKDNFKYLTNFTFDNHNYKIDERRNVYVDNQFANKGTALVFDDKLKFDIKYEELKELKKKKIILKKELLNKQEKIKEILNYILLINNNFDKIEEIEEKILEK